MVPDFVANAGAAAWAWWVIFGLVMRARGIRHLPLVDAAGRLADVIFLDDVLAAPAAARRRGDHGGRHGHAATRR